MEGITLCMKYEMIAIFAQICKHAHYILQKYDELREVIAIYHSMSYVTTVLPLCDVAISVVKISFSLYLLTSATLLMISFHLCLLITIYNDNNYI